MDGPVERFEAAWTAGTAPKLEDYLPLLGTGIGNPPARQSLNDLVAMDLEWRWRQGPGQTIAAGHLPAHPLLEEYVARYPELGKLEQLPLALIEDEYWVRQRWGDQPSHREYFTRFPWFAAALAERLRALDAELGAEFGARPPAVSGYAVVRELGRGGAGVVYLAQHLQLKRFVALKILKGDGLTAPEDRARFRTEAEAAARLQHPNIIQIYEVGERDGCPYLALEYADGGSLSQQLNGAPQPPRLAAALLGELAAAVEAAHQHRIIHRDLKPANILFAKPAAHAPAGNNAAQSALAKISADQWIPKITDFGLAKLLDADDALTQTRDILGTPSYMAPEQASGHSNVPTFATDVYALGTILYELLTGRPPFRASSALETIALVVTADPVAPTRLQPGVPRDLETICLKCLEKDLVKRYRTAKELADDLARFTNEQPIKARALAYHARAARWARRRPAVASLLATVAVLLAVLIGGLSWGLLTINQAREDAVGHLQEARRQQQRAEAGELAARQQQERAKAGEASARLEQANAESARRAEARRRQQARAALDAMSSELVDNWLSQQPQLLLEHRAFLEQARSLYEDFARDTGNDAAAQAGAAGAWHRLGGILVRLGQVNEAEESLRRSRAMYARLLDAAPCRPEYAIEEARVAWRLGNLLIATNRFAEAEVLLREAITRQRQAVAELPADTTLRVALADSMTSLGSMLRKTGRSLEAEKALREAIALREQLVKDQADSNRHRAELARTQNSLGIVLRTTGRTEAAEQSYRAALLLQQQLVREFPGDSSLRVQAARTRMNLGVLLRATGRAAEAVKLYQEAVVALKQVVVELPGVISYRHELADSQAMLGGALLALGRRQEADAALRESQAVLKVLAAADKTPPAARAAVARTQTYQAELLGSLGRPTEAQRAWTEALAMQEELVAASSTVRLNAGRQLRSWLN